MQLTRISLLACRRIPCSRTLPSSYTLRSPSNFKRYTTHEVPAVLKLNRLPKRDNDLPPLSGIELPPHSQWHKYFPLDAKNRGKICVNNASTADLLAEAFVPEGSKDKVIIEAYPGPGQLTRALMRLPRERIRKIIVLEDFEYFAQTLRPLAEADDRVTFLQLNGFHWDSYTHLQQETGLLDDIQKLSWMDGVHPQLQFISHLSLTVFGEQLVAQFFRTIPDQQWLFQFGRVPMNFVLNDVLYHRIIAAPKEKSRCKLSVIAQAVAKISGTLPFELTQPYEDHFYPSSGIRWGKMDKRRIGVPVRTMTAIPLENQVIEKGALDPWDFCLRRLFVQKVTPLEKNLPVLAPGARSLVETLRDPLRPPDQRLDMTKSAHRLTVPEWALVVKAFQDWPFAPEELSISSFTITGNH